MNGKFLTFLACGLAATGAVAGTLNVTADRITGDRERNSLMATGHVVAVHHPVKLMSDCCVKDGDVAHFSDPTTVTTCTNAIGHLHWSAAAEAEYVEGRHVWMKNTVVRFWEIPVLWVPYWYYPLDGENGWRVMPGYTKRWGAYLLTKYVYDIAGDHTHPEGAYWLYGNSRFDLRYENGIAFGQSLHWQLGDFGRGVFRMYYAWDRSDEYDDHWADPDRWNYRNWGSRVPDDRYAFELSHTWEATERDRVRVSGQVLSDSYFRDDFFHDSFFSIKNIWNPHPGNEAAWEHSERLWGTGLGVSGPLNGFIAGVARLPEFNLDVVPQPVWTLPVNYESQTRLGYLSRQYARFGDTFDVTPYSRMPGPWADYEAFRLDTYHRLTAPFKVKDVLSVVPRVGVRETLWSAGGETCVDGWNAAGRTASGISRAILEGGVTFAGRGVATVDEKWRHVLEPYADVLAQEAWHSGLGGNERPYVFDSVDASLDWQDQFAGRSRNLPYSYYGVTPGVRNAFVRTDEKGGSRTVFDVDVYAALQFRDSDRTRGNSRHRLAEPGSPNVGDREITCAPGLRARWRPDADSSLSVWAEYDPDEDNLAIGDVAWNQRIDRSFSYRVSVRSRNQRWWDYSSSPYDPSLMSSDAFNGLDFCLVDVGFEHEVCDAFAWGPFVRWDCHEGEMDSAGSWFEARTDCLGFRLLLEYVNEYERIDGSRTDEDWRVGFYVYLRAFGSGSGDLFGD